MPQHPHRVLEQGRVGALVTQYQKALQVADHPHGGGQAGTVVAVHGMQTPGGDHLRLHLAQHAQGALRELERQVGAGGGDAAGPVEQEMLLVRAQGGQGVGQLGGVDEGEFHLQPAVQTGQDLVAIEGGWAAHAAILADRPRRNKAGAAGLIAPTCAASRLTQINRRVICILT